MQVISKNTLIKYQADPCSNLLVAFCVM